jgi:hypothetical protein
LKRSIRLAMCGRPKLNLTVTTQSTQNNVHLIDKDGQDEECFLLEGIKELKAFMPNYIALVKKLLENVESAE